MALLPVAVYPLDGDSVSLRESITARKSKTITTGHDYGPRNHQQQVNCTQANISVPFDVPSNDDYVDSEDIKSEPVTSGDGEEDHDVDVDIEMEDEDYTHDPLGSGALIHA
jgi:hypothetical protein